jgi:hypothetical protein
MPPRGKACADSISQAMMLLTAQHWLNLAKTAELTARRDSDAQQRIGWRTGG